MSEPGNNTEEAVAAVERRRRRLQGIVVSDKMDKTIVVQVTRRYRHPRYRKYVQERTRYKVHDEQNTARSGDRVEIIETRPLSREKRWSLRTVVERAPIV
ncbi:MAG: 30S ribosomal protein S17 [Myxococcales bacterium FL481]|nr:MAG: 30S ribosomal protein S17 [Myxococcales bacterium FL481]